MVGLVFEFSAWCVKKSVLFDLKKIKLSKKRYFVENKTEIMLDVLKRH